MKYLLMMNVPGAGPYQIASWPRQDIKAHIAFMKGFGQKLQASGELAGYHLLPATKADLYRRLGRAEEAAACYREALALASTDAERRYLGRRLAETGSGGETSSG